MADQNFEDAVDLIFRLQSEYLFSYETIAMAIKIIKEHQLNKSAQYHAAIILACKFNEDFGYQKTEHVEIIQEEIKLWSQIDFFKLYDNPFNKFCSLIEKFVDLEKFLEIARFRHTLITCFKRNLFDCNPFTLLLAFKILQNKLGMDLLKWQASIINLHQNYLYDLDSDND